MFEAGDSAIFTRQGRRRSSRQMVPERDTNTTDDNDSVAPSTSRPLRAPKKPPRIPTIVRSPVQVPSASMITTTAETHVTQISPQNFAEANIPSSEGTPSSSAEGKSDIVDLQSRGSETYSEITEYSSKERKHGNWGRGRVPADTPERRMSSNDEDESLRSTESKDKEKSPADEYLTITMNSTSSGNSPKILAKEEPRKSKSKSSLLKKWTKKMTGSFTTKSSIEEREVDIEKLVPVAEEATEMEAISAGIENEVKLKQTKTKSKKKRSEKLILAPPPIQSEPPAPHNSPPPTPTAPVQVPLSPSTKRNLRRRERAGEFGPDEKLLGIKIHHTDLLPTDPNLCHPVVRITIMNQEGYYLIKSQLQTLEATWQSEPKLTKNCVQQVMTQPSLITGSGLYRLLPKWEEMLVIAEPIEKCFLADAQVLLFFEIMDFVPMGHQSLQGRRKRDADLGWYKIAWAFLKPLGVNGTRHVNRRLRLQLYRPELGKGQNVYTWWRTKRRTKLNSTLYVTLKGILPPEAEHKSPKSNLNALMSMRKDELTEALIEGQLSQGQRSSSQDSQPRNQQVRKPPQWKRFPGQSCKVPNKLLKSLPASEIDSLNFRVVGNVQCVKFSPCGTLLASGLDTDRFHVVLIFEIPSGKLLKCLRGHHGIIYELDWSKINVNPSCNWIASASADSTVRVWKLELAGSDSELEAMPLCVLLHPSYVYALEFSSTVAFYLATGCFDTVIRIWKLPNSIENGATFQEQSAPLFLLNGHRSHINSVRFHPDGKMLFSGDGRGSLCHWQFSSGKQAPTLEKETKLISIGHVAITSLYVDATGRKLLVQLRQNCLKILDVETFLVLNTFQGLMNEKLRLQSVLSPCGNLVLSGSEDASFYIWDADTGRLLSNIRVENHSNCVVSSVTYHPFDHYVAIGLLSDTNEPHPILLYTFEYPAGLSIGTISKLRTTFRGSHSAQSSQSDELLPTATSRGESVRKVDISEKFHSILQKLDEVTGGTPQLASVTAQLMEQNRLQQSSE